ncbi:MAG: hypothetical protein ACO3QA_13125, partial [Phycisphaerales bacterium]
SEHNGESTALFQDGAVAGPTIDFAGDGGLVLQSGRIEGARAGLRGGFVEVRGGLLERQFLAQSRGTVSSGATLRLTGAHLPLNGATVGLERGGVVELPGLDADAARSRALPRIDGEPPPSLRVRGEDSTIIVTSS